MSASVALRYIHSMYPSICQQIHSSIATIAAATLHGQPVLIVWTIKRLYREGRRVPQVNKLTARVDYIRARTLTMQRRKARATVNNNNKFIKNRRRSAAMAEKAVPAVEHKRSCVSSRSKNNNTARGFRISSTCVRGSLGGRWGGVRSENARTWWLQPIHDSIGSGWSGLCAKQCNIIDRIDGKVWHVWVLSAFSWQLCTTETRNGSTLWYNSVELTLAVALQRTSSLQ